MIANSGTRYGELYAPADEVLQSQRTVDAAARTLASGGGEDAFGRSRERFEQIVGWLDAQEAAGLEHGELESRLETEGRELVRCLFQDHLDLRAGREQRVDRVADAAGVERGAVERGHQRPLASVFGQVTVSRLAYRARGEENLHVADGVLNLPAERASHGVRRLAAIESAAGSFEHATGQVRERTGLALGKRQVEELAVRAAVDFDAFYAERVSAANEQEHGEEDVLVLSADGKGIVMRSEALREATAKAAQRASPKLKTRLSKGEKANRKRIAEVGAVYEVTPAPRTPEDVLAPTKEKVLPSPKAKHKWLTASVVEDAATVVADIFDEAQRRDPDQQRTWMALVDGNNHQIDRIKGRGPQAQARGHDRGRRGSRIGISMGRGLVLFHRRRPPTPSSGCTRRRSRSSRERPGSSPPRSAAKPPGSDSPTRSAPRPTAPPTTCSTSDPTSTTPPRSPTGGRSRPA